jgi:hypothetical protein
MRLWRQFWLSSPDGSFFSGFFRDHLIEQRQFAGVIPLSQNSP